MRRVAAVLLLLFPLLIAACEAPNTGLPPAPGRYTLKEKSISFDGERYSFYWADQGGQLHRASARDVKLQLDEENYLEITSANEAIVHLKQDEPVTVEGRDQQGDFGNFWYPFLIGSMLSGGNRPVIVNQPAPREYREPVYRYPPTDRFDRGDTMAGNVTSNRPQPPDYSRVPPVGGTVAGQSGGTGGGNAATNRAEGARPASGQSGGTGGGSAAINKGGSFRSGDQGYGAKVESGQIGSVTGRTAPRVGGGSGALDGKPSISTGTGSAPSPRITKPRSSGSTPRISTGRRR